MKLKFNSYIKTFLTLTVWFICIYKIYIDFDREYLFDSIIHTFLIIVASIISTIVFYSDLNNYKAGKRITSFAASSVTFICLSGLLLVTYLLKKQDQTNTVLHAVRNNSGLGRITIDFRENNTYKLGRHHFMSAEYYRGRYTMTDSIIYLDNPHKSELILSDKLLITKNPSFDSTKKGNILKALFGTPGDDVTATTLLYQINNSGQKLESAISFKVIDKPLD